MLSRNQSIGLKVMPIFMVPDMYGIMLCKGCPNLSHYQNHITTTSPALGVIRLREKIINSYCIYLITGKIIYSMCWYTPFVSSFINCYFMPLPNFPLDS